MKTVKQWLMECLNDEDYKKAEQYKNEFWDEEDVNFREALMSAFGWAHSVEGFDYWKKINNNGGSIKPELGGTPEEVQHNFYSELKALLRKYNAEITIENFSSGWHDENKVVVDFQFDESLFEKNGTGIIPQLVLGTWENGRKLIHN